MGGMGPDTAAAALDSTAPATGLGVPTRVRVLHDALIWNMCPVQDFATQ